MQRERMFRRFVSSVSYSALCEASHKAEEETVSQQRLNFRFQYQPVISLSARVELHTLLSSPLRIECSSSRQLTDVGHLIHQPA